MPRLGIALEDTGEHALRGFDAPRRLFQVGKAGRGE
jgi:hypothetical protein